LRARCSICRKEILVAFSCKLRGVCSSCNARWMCSTAAHLTGRVFPDVPIRQWVLSVPFELRLLLACNAAALGAAGRIFVREIWRWQREQFGASLLRPRNAEALRTPTIRGGAVCFSQRFGGSLTLNVHYHVAVSDGVFGRASQGADIVFHQLPLPNRADLEAIGHAVELRVRRWLRRRGLLDADDADEPDATLNGKATTCLMLIPAAGASASCSAAEGFADLVRRAAATLGLGRPAADCRRN
jgi:hypothetical protein